MHGPLRASTLVAISIIAYAMVSFIHEALGHSLVAASVGARVTGISSVDMSYDEPAVSAGLKRVISAAGALANIVTALVALIILRRKPASANVRYFLWLFLALSFLLATGYLGFSAVIGAGDWANVIRGLPHPVLWRATLFAVSAALYWACLRISVRELASLIGSRSRAVAGRLVIPAYLAGGLLFCAAASVNPAGPRMLVWSAAASFGSMAGIVASLALFTSDEQADLPIVASWSWVLSATVVGALFVGVLGPGITL